jgi:hypothetical protein
LLSRPSGLGAAKDDQGQPDADVEMEENDASNGEPREVKAEKPAPVVGVWGTTSEMDVDATAPAAEPNAFFTGGAKEVPPSPLKRKASSQVVATADVIAKNKAQRLDEKSKPEAVDVAIMPTKPAGGAGAAAAQKGDSDDEDSDSGESVQIDMTFDDDSDENDDELGGE